MKRAISLTLISFTLFSSGCGSPTDSSTEPPGHSGPKDPLPVVYYVKASNTGVDDNFGRAVALSGDGKTLAIGAPHERGRSTGVDGDQADDSRYAVGAVYLYTRDANGWRQEAFIKSTKPEDTRGSFGRSVALSADGNTLAVGEGKQQGLRYVAGRVEIYVRKAGVWNWQASLKASRKHSDFGSSIALSGAGDLLAVGAPSHRTKGAVYVYSRRGEAWVERAYLEPFTERTNFGKALALSDDGTLLAIGSSFDNSGSGGVDANEFDNTAKHAGAVYLFRRDGSSWTREAYVKASEPGVEAYFGSALALSGDGDTLAVGAPGEDGESPDGRPLPDTGAIYLFKRKKGDFHQEEHLLPSPQEFHSQFGAAVALDKDGTTLGIGAHRRGTILFTRQEAGWRRQAVYTTYPAGYSPGRWLSFNDEGTILAVGNSSDESGFAGVCLASEAECATAQANTSARNSGAVFLYQIDEQYSQPEHGAR